MQLRTVTLNVSNQLSICLLEHTASVMFFGAYDNGTPVRWLCRDPHRRTNRLKAAAKLIKQLGTEVSAYQYGTKADGISINPYTMTWGSGDAWISLRGPCDGGVPELQRLIAGMELFNAQISSKISWDDMLLKLDTIRDAELDTMVTTDFVKDNAGGHWVRGWFSDRTSLKLKPILKKEYVGTQFYYLDDKELMVLPALTTEYSVLLQSTVIDLLTNYQKGGDLMIKVLPMATTIIVTRRDVVKARHSGEYRQRWLTLTRVGLNHAMHVMFDMDQPRSLEIFFDRFRAAIKHGREMAELYPAKNS